jgi:hypothetical protein
MMTLQKLGPPSPGMIRRNGIIRVWYYVVWWFSHVTACLKLQIGEGIVLKSWPNKNYILLHRNKIYRKISCAADMNVGQLIA